MRRLFCFLCGKETENLRDGYCEVCYFDKIRTFDIPKKMEFIVCSRCEKMKIGNKWTTKPLEKHIEDKFSLKGTEIRRTGNKFEIVYNTSEKEIKHILNIHLNKITCPVCSRMLGGYYEAIIQLRTDEIDKFAEIIETEISKSKDPMAFYTIKENRTGLDFYLGSKAAANTVGESMRKSYNAKIKKSFKLVTKKDGRDVYRNIILVKIKKAG